LVQEGLPAGALAQAGGEGGIRTHALFRNCLI